MSEDDIKKYKTLKPQDLFEEIPIRDKSDKVAILGTANISKSIKELKEDGYEVWMCGVDKRDGGDRYFEYHGLNVKDREMYREYPDYLKKSPVPLNNTISNMIMIAYHEGYKNILIMGAPMVAKDEYIYQARGMAMVVGYMLGKGINIKWVEAPHHTFYGLKAAFDFQKRNGKTGQ